MNTTTEEVGELQVVKSLQVYAVLFGCIMALGLPLNAVSLWILLRRHSLKSPNTVFMVNLAISDLLLIISLPMRVYVYATGNWPFSSTACLVTAALFYTNIRSSSIFITFISVDRLLAVVYPLRSRHLRTSTNAWKGVGPIWLIMLVASISVTVKLSGRPPHNHTCFVPHDTNDTAPKISPAAYLDLVLTSSLLAVNVVCTAMVLWTLRSHLSESAKVKNKLNVMLIFVLNLLIFTVCFLPMPIIQVTGLQSLPITCLSAVNCCLDPLLYYFSFDAFWKKQDVEPS
ncbi:lysophosphatidic acid receptor 6-like [Acanthochromis polyacanthus]|uniref:lysophosphatidic acid receptor 6-like n=1 Tax=Acanthochromis polyacanthus TaxID=80966 RepID=UPI0022344354|nr:lysophosphatidic acid receptor 6-like [Acanthochromis polyacanthus]